jgi:hypothetical protein
MQKSFMERNIGPAWFCALPEWATPGQIGAKRAAVVEMNCAKTRR